MDFTIAGSIERGFIASLARPGVNITGPTNIATELSAKRLELLAALPRVSRAAALLNPDNPNSSKLPHFLLAAAKKLNVSMLPFNARNSEEIDNAFAAMSRERADTLIVQPEAIFNRHIPQIVGAAVKARLPASYPHSGYVDRGGLMSYGIDYRDHYRGAAMYVAKILKGAKPADLPVEQPTRFELVVNLKTAKALGLTMPPEIMVQATRVIQ